MMRALPPLASLLAFALFLAPSRGLAQERTSAPPAEGSSDAGEGPEPASEPSPSTEGAPTPAVAAASAEALPAEPPLPLAEDYAYWIAREQRLTATLQIHASVHGTRRRTLAAMSIVSGLVLVPIGALADIRWGERYGTYLWTLGGAALVTGSIAAFAATPLEKVQREYLDMGDLSPRMRVTTTERLWAEKGIRRRRLRLAAFGTELFLGVGAITTAFVVGLGSNVDWTEGHRRTTAVALGAVGPILIARGVTHWFAMSDLEASYQAYERTVPTRPVDYRVGAAAVRGGAVVGLHGRF